MNDENRMESCYKLLADFNQRNKRNIERLTKYGNKFGKYEVLLLVAKPAKGSRVIQ